ncbi:Sensor protein EvgS precursor [Salinivirga cyanobacteriivorans]|uniref:histidine kinase n=1 Tax=Salinivirga cyanobacteriivorans TaxID=1307839 RepID=A0A0S2HW88_9BACT|nr:hybrid sensor histidine kinase/response regulator [Salinivirga cyanobacteriivorans]ALO14327.1 Sensor protein EvgS precursor [Salinivirga cyanobacteriivorans]
MTYHTKNQPARILIVDDFISNIQILANMLKPHGYDIEFATTGEEAIDWVQQEPFDLVLLDIMMPEMDGFEVCKKLKENDETKNIPIIFVTAKTDESSIQKGFQVGAVDYIVKPYRESELVERVKTHVTLERQRKELIKTNQAKDRLFSIIGHDLKNPMSNIFGFIKLLKENYKAFDDEKKQKYLHYLFESAKSNLELLEELLEWSRTQTNNKPFRPGLYPVSELIDNALHIMNETAQNKEITIETILNYTGEVYCDKAMINTVLRNLLGNAIKFSHPESSITLKTSAQNNLVKFEVIDQGLGMSKENQQKLFHIDQHVSTLGTNEEKGTGLGLILCKEFIHRHNGQIWVESELNKGSNFSFTLKMRESNKK